MEQLTNAIERSGGQVPSRAIPYVYDFFDLADALFSKNKQSRRPAIAGEMIECGILFLTMNRHRILLL